MLSSILKLCFSVVLPSTVTDPDPGGPGTIQGKTITMDFTITGNQAFPRCPHRSAVKSGSPVNCSGRIVQARSANRKP